MGRFTFQKDRSQGVAWLTIVCVASVTLAASPAVAQLNQTLHADGWILAAAHAPGLHGSIWRTDLWIAKDSVTTTVRLTFCASNTDCTGATEYQVEAPSPQDQVIYIEDVVEEFLAVGGGSWTGAIHYTATGTAQVWARVYSINSAGTASYGQLIEGIPTSDMSPDDDPWDHTQQQYIMAAKHTADNRYRVNIGIVNPTGIQARYDIRSYSAEFNCPPSGCGMFSVTVPPYSMVQTSDPFADFMGGDWNAALIQARCRTDDAGGFAYASVVDNATNDAFFVRGVKRMTPAE